MDTSPMHLELTRTSGWAEPETVRQAAAFLTDELDIAREMDEHEHITTVLLSAAQTIDEFGLAVFHADGLAQSRPWPDDVFGEFSMIVEDLPTVIDSILAGRAAELDFFEQGSARSVHLRPSGDVVLVSGGPVHLGGRPWQPHLPHAADPHALAEMLQSLIDTFAEMVIDLRPEVADLPAFQTWRRRIYAP
jgi:hypothetical protein